MDSFGGVIKVMTLNTENIVKNLCTFAQKIILQDTEPLNEVYLFCLFCFVFYLSQACSMLLMLVLRSQIQMTLVTQLPE